MERNKDENPVARTQTEGGPCFWVAREHRRCEERRGMGWGGELRGRLAYWRNANSVSEAFVTGRSPAEVRYRRRRLKVRRQTKIS